MTKPPKPDPKGYEEEAIPFDDVMRRILQAKPKHREVGKAVKSKKKKKPKNA